MKYLLCDFNKEDDDPNLSFMYDSEEEALRNLFISMEDYYFINKINKEDYKNMTESKYLQMRKNNNNRYTDEKLKYIYTVDSQMRAEVLC